MRRALYRTISDAEMIGSGQVLMPAEVSLANHGLPWLDELLKCMRHVLDV